MTIVGGIITGGAHGLVIGASDVTIRGTEVKSTTNPAQDGAIRSTNVDRVTLDHVYVHDAGGACISLQGGSGHLVEDSELARCAQQGFHLPGVSNTTLLRNQIHDNNPSNQYDPLWEAGGGKASRTTALTFDSNEVYGNHGPGLWCDIYCHNTVYRANRVHDNTYSGIMEEVSYDGLIDSNAVWHNGFSDSRNVWWGANILVSSSTRVTVRANTVYDGQSQIAVIGQTRTDWPLVKPYTGTVDSNTVIGLTGQELIGFLNWDNTTGWSWTQPGTKYWSASGKTVPGTALTTAQKDAALAAAGIP